MLTLHRSTSPTYFVTLADRVKMLLVTLARHMTTYAHVNDNCMASYNHLISITLTCTKAAFTLHSSTRSLSSALEDTSVKPPLRKLARKLSAQHVTTHATSIGACPSEMPPIQYRSTFKLAKFAIF